MVKMWIILTPTNYKWVVVEITQLLTIDPNFLEHNSKKLS